MRVVRRTEKEVREHKMLFLAACPGWAVPFYGPDVEPAAERCAVALQEVQGLCKEGPVSDAGIGEAAKKNQEAGQRILASMWQEHERAEEILESIGRMLPTLPPVLSMEERQKVRQVEADLGTALGSDLTGVLERAVERFLLKERRGSHE